MNKSICMKSMERIWWPVAGTTIFPGSYCWYIYIYIYIYIIYIYMCICIKIENTYSKWKVKYVGNIARYFARNKQYKRFPAQMNFLIYSRIFLSDRKQIILITILKSVPSNFWVNTIMGIFIFKIDCKFWMTTSPCMDKVTPLIHERTTKFLVKIWNPLNITMTSK